MKDLTSKIINAIPLVGVVNFMPQINFTSTTGKQVARDCAKWVGHVAYNLVVAVYLGSAIQTGSLNPIEQTRTIREQVAVNQTQNPLYSGDYDAKNGGFK